MIKSEHLDDRNIFFDNHYLNRLVTLSLENLDNNVFLNIITLITLDTIDTVENMMPIIKSDPECSDTTVYDDVLNIFKEIHKSKHSSNLRGAFLELLTFKFINKKYGPFQLDFDCYVITNGIKSEKTVDVFALCENFQGLVCECKISHNNFKEYHLSNLNTIFYNSNNILTPYIITFSSQNLIEKILIKIVQDDETNVYVHLNDIHVISNTNIMDFFKF